MTKQTVRWFCLGIMMLFTCNSALAADPQLTIPALPKAPIQISVPQMRQTPVIDGNIGAEEWQFASALTGFVKHNVNQLCDAQTTVYLGRDSENLYMAIRSWGKFMVANCVSPDSQSICADDEIEMLIAPGTGEAIKGQKFPTFYLILNSIGMIFDQYRLLNLAETHPEWNVKWETAQKNEGEEWTVEIKIPFSNFGDTPPKDGDTWAFNLARAYYPYQWTSLVAGGLNNPECAATLRFDSASPAVRLVSVEPLLKGKAGITLEIANGTLTETQVAVSCRIYSGSNMVYETNQPIALAANKSEKIDLGNGAALGSNACLEVRVTSASGRPCLVMDRVVAVPPATINLLKERPVAVQKFYFYPRYYPSLDRLVSEINFSQVDGKTAVKQARITVYSDEALKKPVATNTLEPFTDFAGVQRMDTAKLSDGKYFARAELLDANGKNLGTAEEWFIKGRPEWLTHKRGIGDKVLPPFTPLRVSRQEVTCWGRRYLFNEQGLMKELYTRNVQILAEPMRLVGAVNGQSIAWERGQPIKWVKKSAAQVSYTSVIKGNGLAVKINSTIEYDGLMVTELRYGPESGQPVNLDSLRFCIALKPENAFLYMAIPDAVVGIKHGVLKADKGVIFSSGQDVRNAQMRGTFLPYLWVGDRDRGLCWVAESDQGWISDDTNNCVQVERTDQEVILWFNLVNRPAKIDRERKLIFGLQASPVKPIMNKWRGVFMGGFKHGEVPVLFRLLGGNPPGSTSMDWTRPQSDPAMIEKGRWRLWDKDRSPGMELDVVSGYYYWGTTCPGEEAAKLFRGEWISKKDNWYYPQEDESQNPRYTTKSAWGPWPFGKDPDNYKHVYVVTVPSYVDYQVWSFEEAVKTWKISGFYDDCGYMRAIYDEDLGIGYVREDGIRQPALPILSVYREKWKRCAYVLDKLGHENYLCSWANYNALPVCAWSGCMAVGEQSLAKDGDYIDSYGSLEKFATYFPGLFYGLPSFACQRVPIGQERQATLLYFLHDINWGWTHRNPMKEITGLTRAKAQFKPWEDDVEFHGYWQPQKILQVADDNIKISYYTAKNRVMFMVGNLAKHAVSTTLKVDWAKLGIKPVKLTDMETNKELPINAEGGLQVKIPARDLRLILATASAQ